MTMRTTWLLLFGFLLLACDPQPGFDITRIHIVTSDVEELSGWYQKNFGFKVVEEDHLTYKGLNLYLEENSKAVHRDTLKGLHNVNNVPGFYKLGFLTNQFDNLVEQLKGNGVQFVGSVVYDERLEKRMLVIKDPDGNRLQLFEDNGKHKLKPYLISIIVEGIGEQEKWYQMKLPVLETINLDLPEGTAYIRVLRGKDFLIELIKVDDTLIRSQLDYDQIFGFHTIEIAGANATLEGDHEQNNLINP